MEKCDCKWCKAKTEGHPIPMTLGKYVDPGALAPAIRHPWNVDTLALDAGCSYNDLYNVI